MTTNLDPEQRARLLAGKLRALVKIDRGDAVVFADDAPAFPAGTAVIADGELWVLLESGTSGLGAMLAWAEQQWGAGVVSDAGALHLVVDGDARSMAGMFARQAGYFVVAPTVLVPEGRELRIVAPEPIAPAPEPPAAALALADELRAAGLEVIVEHGTVRGEVDGLEVALVLLDDDGVARIECGVGRNDREAFGLLHGDLPPSAAMRKVADTVRQHRRPGANPHPLNRMASERWLRSHLLGDDHRLGTWQLEPVPGPVPRISVAEAGPAFAHGTDDTGAPVVVACSIGIDLDLVPAAADARAWLDPEAELVLAMPARDAHPVTERLGARLARPARLLPIEGEWRR